jgi:hypothetical protein
LQTWTCPILSWESLTRSKRAAQCRGYLALDTNLTNIMLV